MSATILGPDNTPLLPSGFDKFQESLKHILEKNKPRTHAEEMLSGIISPLIISFEEDIQTSWQAIVGMWILCTKALTKDPPLTTEGRGIMETLLAITSKTAVSMLYQLYSKAEERGEIA